MSEIDMVNHPPHYRSENGIECIDAIEAAVEELIGVEAVYTANTLKYLWRWKKKNGVEDLKKAQWYLDRLVEYENQVNNRKEQEMEIDKWAKSFKYTSPEDA